MPREAAALGGLIAAALLGCSHTRAARELVVHEFSSSTEGWQVAGDTSPAAPVFHPAGGRSGGYISHTDEALGETWYFQAPPSVLSQLAAAAGGRLEYSLKQDSAEAGFPD